MSLFKSKKSKYPSESKWNVLKGEYNGRPIIVRLNDSAKDLLGSPDYKYRIGVAVPLHSPTESGLPTKDEDDILYKIEDELCALLGNSQNAIQVLAIATNGMREFIFYSRNTQNIEQSINLIRSKFPSYEIQSYSREDKDWALYKNFEHGF